MTAAPTPLYLFLDEGGNFDFSPSGTRFLTLTAVTTSRPFLWDAPLAELRYDLLEAGLDIEYFHASDDRQAVRDRVFGVIGQFLPRLTADTVVLEKAKVAPADRSEARLYSDSVFWLLDHILTLSPLITGQELIVVTDRLPVHKKRDASEKAIRTTVRELLPADTRFRVLHHDSKSCPGLQVADYINWAVYRTWDRGDDRSLRLIEPAVRTQLDLLGGSAVRFY